jgi:hypothetical protein
MSSAESAEESLRFDEFPTNVARRKSFLKDPRATRLLAFENANDRQSLVAGS